MAITAVFAWNLQNLAFDFEFEKFIPRDHPETKLFKEHVAQFGYDNDYLQIILENEGSIFDTAFLQKALGFENTIQLIDDVVEVYSPLTIKHVVKSPTGLIVFPVIHTDSPRKLRSDSIRIFGNEFYRSAFSKNGEAFSIYLQHAHFDDPVRSENLLAKIEEQAKKYELDNIRLVGKLSASGVFLKYMQEDFGVFLVGSLILSFGLLLLIFGNFKSALLPFFISIMSIVWMLGLMGLINYKLNLLSSLIPPILFFVSMSNAVHFLNALGKVDQTNKKDQLLAAMKIVFIPTLLTCVTTAVGFISLLWINTEPIQNLGLFAGLGILFAFIITFSFGLWVASFSNFSKKRIPIEVPERFIQLLLRNKKQFIAGLVIILIALIPGIFQLKINTFLLEDLPEDSQVRQDFEYSDQNLGGSKPYEVRVEVADTALSIWDKKVMDEILKIENYLINEFPLAKVQSPATVVKYLTMVNQGGLNENYGYPENDRSYKSTLRLKNRIDPKRMNKLVTAEDKVARLVGFFPELGSYETGLRNLEFLKYMEENIDTSLIKYHITGTTYLMDKSHELLSTSLIYGLLTAIGIVGIILGLYFRSWKLLIISLIPNLIPLLMVAGILGWLGISLKMVTSIIFAIAFGIAVDDTIHMMSSYLNKKDEDPVVRIKSTFKHAGSAVIITSIIMCGGFCIFLFSNFGATYYLGLFITISLLVALLVDLTILPILMVLFVKKTL